MINDQSLLYPPDPRGTSSPDLFKNLYFVPYHIPRPTCLQVLQTGRRSIHTLCSCIHLFAFTFAVHRFSVRVPRGLVHVEAVCLDIALSLSHFLMCGLSLRP